MGCKIWVMDIYPGSKELLNKSTVRFFFGLYFVMTGLHALHVIIGMVILTFMIVFILRKSVTLIIM